MKKKTNPDSEEKRTSRHEPALFPTHNLSRGDFHHRARSFKPAPLGRRSTDSTILAKRLRQFRMFKRVPASVLKILAAGAQLRSFRQSELLWHRDDSVNNITLIESGFVKASRQDRNGVSKTYGLFGPGDSMGLYAFWAGMGYITDAVALNDGVNVITFGAGEISRLAEQNPQFSRNLKDEVTRFSQAFIHKIEIISAGTIEQRLAVLLLQLVDRYGVDREGEQVRLPVFLTQAQISEIIDARIETVARSVSQWKRAGWLTLDAHGWHFNCLDKLRGLLDN